MIRVTSDSTLEQRPELEKEVDADIADFSSSFQALGNGALLQAEHAIIKTYLAWKLGIVPSPVAG